MKKGDWGFIVGADRITPDYFKKIHPKGIFGKIIEIESYYSRFSGKKLPIKINVRAYTKEGICHLRTTKKYFKKL